MSFNFGSPEENLSQGITDLSTENSKFEIQMEEGLPFVPLGKWQIKRKYEDEIGPRLLLVLDEVAELLLDSKLKSEEGKQETQITQEILSIIQSITQLGRSAGIHCIICTQRNDKSLINGIIQNNSLALDTKLRIRRPIRDNQS